MDEIINIPKGPWGCHSQSIITTLTTTETVFNTDNLVNTHRRRLVLGLSVWISYFIKTLCDYKWFALIGMFFGVTFPWYLLNVFLVCMALMGSRFILSFNYLSDVSLLALFFSVGQVQHWTSIVTFTNRGCLWVTQPHQEQHNRNSQTREPTAQKQMSNINCSSSYCHVYSRKEKIQDNIQPKGKCKTMDQIFI